MMYTHSTDAGWISRTHKAIAPYRLQKPETVSEVLEALSQSGTATIIAGGIDLTRRMRGGDTWDEVVDISGVADLKGISRIGDNIRIGALATHWEVETDPILRTCLPDFQVAWKTIGNIRIRMTGTVGGNLMAAEAGYDGHVLLAAAGARLIFASVDGEVSVPAVEAADRIPANALLMALEIPVTANSRLGFDRNLKPVVSVAVGLDDDRATVAVGCAFDHPLCWSGSVAEVGSCADLLPDPKNNPMGSAAYRRRMIGVLARRLTDNLQAEAGS
jgi:aerobic carbon-monoxide dehydrogenase medium subunit